MSLTRFFGVLYVLNIFTTNAFANKRKQRVRRKAKISHEKYDELISDLFQNEEGGNVNSPKGFYCLSVIALSDDTLGCRYKKNGVNQSNKLDDDHGSLKCKRGQAAFITNGTLKDGKIKIPSSSKVICKNMSTSQKKDSTNDSVSRIATRTALIFRVTSNGVAPSDTASQLSDYVFGTNGFTPNAASMLNGCSFGQMNLSPATGSNIVNGVVEVDITPPSTEYQDMSNSAMSQAQNNLSINTDSYNHLMFALPSTMTDGGLTPGWAGIAFVSSKESWFKDQSMHIAPLTVHELGHNLGLEHSNELEEYGDLTCVMGFGGTLSAPYACFNAAKMNQLGWYTNRETFINPLTSSFSGKLIGVNDYGISTSQHTLVLEVDYSTSINGNLFLFYNIAEGITADTAEYSGEIIVNQVLAASGKSEIVYHIAVGSSQTVSNIIGSRDLIISFDRIGSDGNVDYAFVTVMLAEETCSASNDCNDLITCTEDSCSNSICSFQLTSNCCGNGSCEFTSQGETCGSCASDCSVSAKDCGELNARSSSYRWYSSSGTYGSLFNIRAKVDLSVHSISFVMIDAAPTLTPITSTVTIYSKESTWFSASDSTRTSTSGWTQVFSGSSTSAIVGAFTSGKEIHLLTIELDSTVNVSSGNLQAFYIQVITSSNEHYSYGGEGTTWNDDTVQIESSDMILYEAAFCFGNGWCSENTVKIQGKIGYMYQKASPVSPATPIPVSLPPTSPPTPIPVLSPTIRTATLEANSNGLYKVFGNMFYITSKLDVNILQIMIKAAEKKASFKIFTRNGSKLPNKLKKWSLYHKKKTTGTGANANTELGAFSCGIDILSGDSHAFYIKASKKFFFNTKDSNPTDIVVSDSYITIMHGKAQRSKEKVSKKFVWNGAVQYLTGASGSCS